MNRSPQLRIKFKPLTISQNNLPGGRINVAYLAQQHANVFLGAQDAAQGRGNLARRERSRRHLVHQGLKKVIVAAIDEGDRDRRGFESSCGIKPAKTPSKDNNFVRAAHRSAGPHDHCLLNRMPRLIRSIRDVGISSFVELSTNKKGRRNDELRLGCPFKPLIARLD